MGDCYKITKKSAIMSQKTNGLLLQNQKKNQLQCHKKLMGDSYKKNKKQKKTQLQCHRKLMGDGYKTT